MEQGRADISFESYTSVHPDSWCWSFSRSIWDCGCSDEMLRWLANDAVMTLV